MNLYLITQNENNHYNTYDAAVVAAASEAAARLIVPGSIPLTNGFADGAWASSPEHVKAELIGTACPSVLEGAIICASFNAG